jgi:hypothetical protein
VANILRRVSSAGVSCAAALLLDAAELVSDNLIALTELILNVYGAGKNYSRVISAWFAAGILLFNLIPSPGQENNLVNTFVFDDVETALLPPLFAPDLRIGLSASFTSTPNAHVTGYPQWARRSQPVVLHA